MLCHLRAATSDDALLHPFSVLLELGRGQLAVFPRCSLGSYRSRYGRFVTASPAQTALKNSQLTCGDVTIICETAH